MNTCHLLSALMVLCMSLCLVNAQSSVSDTTLVPAVDLVSAHQVRVRYKLPDYSIKNVFIQYTTQSNFFISGGSTASNAQTWHNYIVANIGVGAGDHEITKVQGAGILPATSVIVTGLQPSTSYIFRIAVQDASDNYAQGLSTDSATTLAEGSNPSFSYFLVSGGCGTYTSGTPDENNTVTYSCEVASGVSEISFKIIPSYFFSVVDLPYTLSLSYNDTYPPSGDSTYASHGILIVTNSSVSVTDTSVSTIQYTYAVNYYLNDDGSNTELAYRITSENGNQTTYIINIYRLPVSDTMQVNGPSSQQSVSLTSPVSPISLQYLALRWSNTFIPSNSSWKAWSDSPDIIGPESFEFTFPQSTDIGFMTLNVYPLATSNKACINLHVSVSDNHGGSAQHKTCVVVYADQCSTTPTDTETSWPSYTDTSSFYFPPPPYNGFPTSS